MGNSKSSNRTKAMNPVFLLFFKTQPHCKATTNNSVTSKCQVEVRRDWKCTNKDSTTQNNTVSNSWSSISKQPTLSSNKTGRFSLKMPAIRETLRTLTPRSLSSKIFRPPWMARTLAEEYLRSTRSSKANTIRSCWVNKTRFRSR